MIFVRKVFELDKAVLFGVLAITAVALEVVSARLAYETLGAVASTFYWAAMGINLPCFAVAFRTRLLAGMGIVLLGLGLIPYQFVLAERLWRVQTEATRIRGFQCSGN